MSTSPPSAGRVALVTGASAGIGREAALTLVRAGFRTFATARREEALAELARQAQGLPLETLVLDVDDAASIDRAREEVLSRTEGRGVDVLVNNAGYGMVGALEEVSDEALVAQFRTNVFGLMGVTRAFLPGMRARGWGRVIQVSSIAGRVALPFWGAYNATKFALEGLSDALRMEVRQFGVRVILIEPGAIRTSFQQRSESARTRGLTPGSLYASAMERYPKLLDGFYRLAPGPRPVARAVLRAACARWPRARYVVPRWNYMNVLLGARIPTFVVDWAMRRIYGL